MTEARARRESKEQRKRVAKGAGNAAKLCNVDSSGQFWSS